jgi:hypothetical protein
MVLLEGVEIVSSFGRNGMTLSSVPDAAVLPARVRLLTAKLLLPEFSASTWICFPRIQDTISLDGIHPMTIHGVQLHGMRDQDRTRILAA